MSHTRESLEATAMQHYDRAIRRRRNAHHQWEAQMSGSHVTAPETPKPPALPTTSTAAPRQGSAIMASATDRFNARVETLMEAERVHGKKNTGAVTPRGRAISQIIADDPQLHAAYLEEFNAKHNARQAARFTR